MLRDRTLIVDAAFVHAIDQGGHRRLQIDDQIGRRRLRLQMRIHLVVERKLVVIEIEPCEQRVLVEQEVGNRRAAEHVELGQAADLVHPLEQKIELRRQREARHVVVEARQERVFVRRFEQRVGVEMVRERLGETGFAGADRALDDDIVAFGQVHRRSFLAPDVAAGARDALPASTAKPRARGAAAGDAGRRRDIDQRPQHECALMHPRMRQRKLRSRQSAAAE